VRFANFQSEAVRARPGTVLERVGKLFAVPKQESDEDEELEEEEEVYQTCHAVSLLLLLANRTSFNIAFTIFTFA